MEAYTEPKDLCTLGMLVTLDIVENAILTLKHSSPQTVGELLVTDI